MIAIAGFRSKDRARVMPLPIGLLPFVVLLLCAASCSPPLAVCRAHGPLPDPLCTPGAVDTRSIGVVCGTRTRDRRFVDRSTRRRVLETYGVPFTGSSQYEVDHLIPLELGGSNAVTNLWAEPIAEARQKDRLEDAAHAAVCSRRMRLEDAQRAFSSDWTRLARQND
jgi:hypothetical protein